MSYLSLIGTNPSGTDSQPGACVIGRTGLQRPLRDNESQHVLVTDTHMRYADHTFYDPEKCVYCSEEKVMAETQNKEQMIGLWKKHQREHFSLTALRAFPKLDECREFLKAALTHCLPHFVGRKAEDFKR